MAKKAQVATPAVPLKLQGKTVFIAGNFYHLADSLRNIIMLEGGKVANELTDKTDLMILGHSGIANPQKTAAKLNAQTAAIQILSSAQLNQMIKPTPDEAVQLLLSGPQGIERWNRHCDWTPQQTGLAASVRGADFSNADLSNANLGDLLEHCDFSGAKLKGCQLVLSHCQLKGAVIDSVDVLNLVDCAAERVDFRRIDDWTNIHKSHVRFIKCQLDSADFSGLQIPKATFDSCCLKNAKFRGTNLEEADFSGSDLTGAIFTNASLKLGKLAGAKVDGTDFAGATMIGADVAQVDFSKARGFDPSQVQAQGGPGAAVQEFLKVAAQAQRASTSMAVTRGSLAVVLRLDHSSYWTHFHDSVGNHYYTNQQQQVSPVHLWTTMATKWHGATPDIASVTMRSTKAPIANKELKQLAVRAWCELFGVEPPSDEDLKKAAISTKAQKKEKADEWFELLRTGKKGVAQWNGNVVALAKILNKISGVDLANAKLGGLKLQNMEWKGANLSGANLTQADVMRCRFPEGNFAGANLQGAKLRISTFHDANLANADATSADLCGTSLKRANCQGAKFVKAELRAADLCGANFTGADLTEAVLVQASYDENTRWPKGFTPTLEMIWKGPGTSPAAHKLVQSTKPKGKLDIEQFMTRLEELTDAAKLAKALNMLKADRFRLYAQVQEDHFVGVVKSQSDADLAYSCRLSADGTYACCTQNLNFCGGLRGSLCKHLLVLIVGLAKNNELDPNVIDTWIRLSKSNKPALDKDAMSETFLRYKGAEAGEVDWRPTETIPEDYYAM